MIGLFVMIPIAFSFAFIWPHIQELIGMLQGFLKASGVLGIWVYNFLERLCLYYFIYLLFIFYSAVVRG